MWDLAGGRYSLWSDWLAHCHRHWLPKSLRLTSWRTQYGSAFCAKSTEHKPASAFGFIRNLAISTAAALTASPLPYSHELRLLPDYLQQLVMESNGKQVDKQGNLVSHRTCTTIWGSAGTIGQHSFHQLLHQGTENIPVDFILPLSSLGERT